MNCSTDTAMPLLVYITYICSHVPQGLAVATALAHCALETTHTTQGYAYLCEAKPALYQVLISRTYVPLRQLFSRFLSSLGCDSSQNIPQDASTVWLNLRKSTVVIGLLSKLGTATRSSTNDSRTRSGPGMRELKFCRQKKEKKKTRKYSFFYPYFSQIRKKRFGHRR